MAQEQTAQSLLHFPKPNLTFELFHDATSLERVAPIWSLEFSCLVLRGPIERLCGFSGFDIGGTWGIAELSDTPP